VEFDFLGDAQHHKLLWTDQVRQHGSYYLFSRRLRARAVGLAKSVMTRLRRSDFNHIVRRREHGSKQQ
jgi:hypothetical protein